MNKERGKNKIRETTPKAQNPKIKEPKNSLMFNAESFITELKSRRETFPKIRGYHFDHIMWYVSFRADQLLFFYEKFS